MVLNCCFCFKFDSQSQSQSRELETEIRKMNQDEFKWGVNWQQVLMALIEDHQAVEEEEGKVVIEEWKEEVRGIQDSLRAMFNPHFGSTFRSHNNPTYFSRKLFRYNFGL